MKTYCQKCDHPNDLGHLFCTKCGAKLVLEHVREDLETDGVLERTKGRFFYVVFTAIVLVIIVGVVAVWPGKPFKKEVAVGNLDAMETTFTRLTVAAESSKTPFTNQPIREDDVNAWLATACQRAGAKSMTVSFKPGSCKARVVFTAGPWKLFKTEKTFGPISYSRDFTFGVTSNGLSVTGAKVGHLPMFGPLVKIVADRTARGFGDFAKERNILSRVVESKVDDGQITIAVMSRQ